MSLQGSNVQMLNESQKMDSTMLKNNSRFNSNNSSLIHGIENADELRLGQNKRQNLFLDDDLNHKMQKIQSGEENDDDIEFEEDIENDDTNKIKIPHIKQLSSFSNAIDLYKNSSGPPSQYNDSYDNASQLSPSRRSYPQPQQNPNKNLIVSPTKDMQKHTLTSSSSSSSSSDSDGSPGGSPGNTGKIQKKQQMTKSQKELSGARRKENDVNSLNFRKKRIDKENSSRLYDHENSGIRNFDMKKKKTSLFMYDEQSQNNMSVQNHNPNNTNKQNYKRRMSSKRQPNSKDIWNSKVFSIIMFINRLIYTLKKSLIFTRPQLLTTLQLNLINDKSSRDIGEGWGTREDKLQKLIQKGFHRNELMGKFQKKYKNMRKAFKKKFKRFIILQTEVSNVFKKINKMIPVFDPMSKWLFFWEMTIFMITSFNFIYIPFDYSFGMAGNELHLLYFDKVCPAIFLTDIAIRFNTSYFHRGYLVQDRKKIIKNYIITLFFVDLITAFSLFYDFFDFEGSYLIFFVRIFYFSKILDKITESIMLNTKLSGTVSLLLLLAEVQFVCHVFTCAWHSLGQYELGRGNQSWLSVKQNLHDPVSLYINSYYFCTITMTTIGFGDITAQNDLEKIFVSFMSILASGIFGYSLNFIGSILMDMKKQKELFQQRLAEINQYMTKHNVQSHLQSKTRKYLEYIHSEGVDKQQQPEKSLDYLSKFLKEEILKDVYLKSIKNIHLFESKFGQAFKERLALRMKEQIYGPDEIIVKKGNYEVPRIYIIMRGEVELYWEVGSNKQIQTKENEKKLKFLKEGSSFGFIEFFTSNYESFISAKSKGVSQIQYIQLDDFLDLLQDFENEKEIYCFIRDSVSIKKEYKMISAPCFSCASYEHLIHECPLLFYDSNKEKIIKTYNKNFIEERKNFSRDLRRCKYQTLINCITTTNDVCNFRERTVFKTESEYTDSEGDYDEESYDEEIEDDEDEEEEQEDQQQKKQETTNDKSDSDEEASKKSKRKRIRSQSVKQPTQIIQAQQANHRGSLLGEDLLRQTQQRRSLLLQGFDDKMPSIHSINRLPSLGSKANRQSFAGQIPLKKENIGSSYDPMGTVNETEITNEKVKTNKGMEINQNIVKDYIYYHYQQQQLQQQQKPENYIEDRVCSYEIYFPHNNVRNIIEEMERIKKKWRSKSIQRQRRTGLKDKLITLKQLHTLKTMFADKFDSDSHQNISMHQD